jgi:ATP synthase protein I
MSDPAGSDRNGGSNRGEISPEERAAFEKRVTELDQRLQQAEARQGGSAQGASRGARGDASGMGEGLRLAAELVAGVAVGGLIGYGLDRFLGTSPWLFLVFFFLGVAAGCLNAFRAAVRLQDRADPASKMAPSAKDDDED